MTRRLAIVLAALAAVLLLAIAPAQAILHGQPDGLAHPYVGEIANNQNVCSGALISPTVFITAAHCFSTSGEQVSVTVDPNGFGPQTTPISGHWYPDPQFRTGSHGLPDFFSHDVAVVILDQPIQVSRYASLPNLNLLDTLPMKQPITVVGYGFQVPVRDYTGIEMGTRYRAPALLVQSNDVVADEFLKVSANPAQGKGGTCFADSGGPVLLGDTILAVNSFLQSQCTGVTYTYRLDTTEALRFIQSTIAAYS